MSSNQQVSLSDLIKRKQEIQAIQLAEQQNQTSKQNQYNTSKSEANNKLQAQPIKSEQIQPKQIHQQNNSTNNKPLVPYQNQELNQKLKAEQKSLNSYQNNTTEIYKNTNKNPTPPHKDIDELNNKQSQVQNQNQSQQPNSENKNIPSSNNTNVSNQTNVPNSQITNNKSQAQQIKSDQIEQNNSIKKTNSDQEKSKVNQNHQTELNKNPNQKNSYELNNTKTIEISQSEAEPNREKQTINTNPQQKDTQIGETIKEEENQPNSRELRNTLESTIKSNLTKKSIILPENNNKSQIKRIDTNALNNENSSNINYSKSKLNKQNSDLDQISEQDTIADLKDYVDLDSLKSAEKVKSSNKYTAITTNYNKKMSLEQKNASSFNEFDFVNSNQSFQYNSKQLPLRSQRKPIKLEPLDQRNGNNANETKENSRKKRGNTSKSSSSEASSDSKKIIRWKLWWEKSDSPIRVPVYELPSREVAPKVGSMEFFHHKPGIT
jgi:hypothetical protein